MSWVRARAGEERGAVFVFVAVIMVVLVGSAALAVDIGQLTNERRDLQKVADAIALDSARAINGTSVGTLLDPTTGAVTLAAQASAARNKIPYSQLEVQLGNKPANGPFVQQTGAAIPNAVKVVARGTVDFAFAPGSSDTSRQGVATQNAVAGFSVGSFLASIPAGGNTVLSGIFGDAFGVSVLSYNGLLGANVTLEAIGLNFPTGVLTPSQVLSTDLEVGDLMLASANALRLQGEDAAATVLDQMRLSMPSDVFVNLGDAIIADTGAQSAAATAELNVLQMLTTAAFIADGNHAISIPQTDLNIPGIGSVGLSLDVIEPPKIAFGPVGTSAETAQVNLTLTPRVQIGTSTNVSNVCGLQGLLGNLLGCLLGTVSGVLSVNINADVPISLQIAGGKATLTGIQCNAPQSITLLPELQPLNLVSNVDLVFTGSLLGTNLGDVLRIRANGGAKLQSTAPAQNFLNPSEFGIVRSIGSTPLGLAGLTNLTASNVSVLNLSLGSLLNPVANTLLGLVNTALGSLDSILVNPLNDLLGLNVGGVDLTALTGSLSCSGVKLVE